MTEPVVPTTTPDASAPTRRVRARLARLGGTRAPSGNPVLEPLFRSVRQSHPKADLRLLERAYDVAEECHRGQLRRSGDPYITHPLSVATILAELGMEPPTLCAALLHDTVEDTDYTLEAVEADFGSEIASLVDGVTKLDKVHYGDAAQAETVRKMVIAMARDIRVLVIKLADRLHNMRTLRYMPQAKQERTARETLEIYAPLAHRLGMNTVKWELEDLSFATLYPKMYDEIVRLVADRAPSRDDYLAVVIDQVTADLRTARIKARVTGRPKHYYSIYQKMIVRGRDFADIYDLVGIRILVESVRDCYATLGAVHARWNPVPGRFKDYIAMPKFNMYQSLHTTVIGPEGKPVELQIRSHAMHRRAEYGVAAHWKYKAEVNGEQSGAAGTLAASSGEKSAGEDMVWLRQLLDWQKETADPGEFLESLRFDLGTSEVYVFTPNGDAIALPTGSTPVDLAYAVHTEVGHRCIGARVNGRLVPLESKLDQRRRGGDPHREGHRLRFRAEPGLVGVRRQPAGAQQDQAALLQGAPRGSDRARQGADRPRDAQAGTADPAPDDLRVTDRDRARAAPGRHLRPLRRGRRGPQLRAGGRPAPRAVARRYGLHHRGRRRGRLTDEGPRQDPPARRPRRRGEGRGRRLGQARALLHPGAGRRDHRLRHPWQRSLGAPHRLHQRGVLDGLRSRSAWSRWSGRRLRPRCSWSRSRSRPSTAPACSPTSPACCPTST